MSARARLTGIRIEFDVVTDDGDNLAPLPPRSAAILPADLDRIPTLVREALDGIQADLDAEGADQ